MKKIIDGKVYDTGTAEEVASWKNGYRLSDFKHCEETLHKTGKGAFFIYGEGGAMSLYSESYGDMQGSGEGIRALTHEEAMTWIEEREIDPETVKAYFTFEEA